VDGRGIEAIARELAARVRMLQDTWPADGPDDSV
jgi:hypothetical protein